MKYLKLPVFTILFLLIFTTATALVSFPLISFESTFLSLIDKYGNGLSFIILLLFGFPVAILYLFIVILFSFLVGFISKWFLSHVSSLRQILFYFMTTINILTVLFSLFMVWTNKSIFPSTYAGVILKISYSIAVLITSIVTIITTKREA